MALAAFVVLEMREQTLFYRVHSATTAKKNQQQPFELTSFIVRTPLRTVQDSVAHPNPYDGA